MPDAFGNPVKIGDRVVIAYRNGGPMVLETRLVTYVSSAGVPYYYTTHAPAQGKAGSTGPQLRAAKEPIYVVRT